MTSNTLHNEVEMKSLSISRIVIAVVVGAFLMLGHMFFTGGLAAMFG